MDFGGLLVLGVVWLLFNLLGSRKGQPRAERKVQPPRPAPSPPGTVDPTRQEGSRLEQLLRELERNLEGVAGTQPAPSPRLPSPKRPSAPPRPLQTGDEEDVEEGGSLEEFGSLEGDSLEGGSLEEPERVISLEDEVQRPSRARYTHDAEAEEIARRRVKQARSRDRALNKADHRAFDARIRQEPADHTAVPRYTTAQLRDAVVWREILGPPVSERQDIHRHR